MPKVQSHDRWAKLGRWAGLVAFSFFLAKGLAWLIVPALVIGSCTK